MSKIITNKITDHSLECIESDESPLGHGRVLLRSGIEGLGIRLTNSDDYPIGNVTLGPEALGLLARVMT